MFPKVNLSPCLFIQWSAKVKEDGIHQNCLIKKYTVIIHCNYSQTLYPVIHNAHYSGVCYSSVLQKSARFCFYDSS